MEWLEQMGLQPSLTPETAGEVFLLVEQGQQAMQLENNALSKLRLLESEQKSIQTEGGRIFGDTGGIRPRDRPEEVEGSCGRAGPAS